MAKRTFKTDLSVKGMENLKKQLLDYKNNTLQQKLNILAKTLSEKGVVIAQANISGLDAIFTGELINSIHARKGSGSKGTAIFYIVADSKHAAFVEFGTGVIGESSPYPYPFPENIDWQYQSGDSYVTLDRQFGKYPPGTYGWFYIKDGHLYFTQGMPSRPFMYETSMELMQLVVRTAKEVFG